MQQVELVAVERLLDGIDDYIDLVSGELLGDLVALAHGASVALREVGGTPRRIEMMHRDGSFLRIDARSEHGGRAENNPHLALVHRVDNGLARFLVLALLNEAYLRGGDAVILHELAFDFAVHVELRSTLLLLGRGNKFPLPSLNRRGPLPRLKRPQIREDELRSFLLVVLAVVFGNHAGAVACFVVHVVVVVRVDHTHVEGHFAGIVRCNQHFCFLFGIGELAASQ